MRVRHVLVESKERRALNRPEPQVYRGQGSWILETLKKYGAVWGAGP